MRIRSRRGSVTIEATIALTAFLFMFMMVYSVITITRAEAKIGFAINNVAKEISQYSYVYGMTGLNDKQKAMTEKGAEAKEKANETLKSISETFDALQLLRSDGEDVFTDADVPGGIDVTNIDIDTWNSIEGKIDNLEAAGSEALKNLEEIAENPKELMLGLGNVFVGKTLDVAKSRLIAVPVSRALVKKNLKRTPNDNPEECLRSLGLVPGKNFSGEESYIHGIDFSQSMLFPEGENDILIVAKYKLKLFKYLPLDIEFEITQVAATVGWLNGDGGQVEKVSTEK